MIGFLKKYIWREDFERICELEREVIILTECRKNQAELISEAWEENRELKNMIEVFTQFSNNCFDQEYPCEFIGADVAVFVEDLAGGKVIKQEANKCIKISKDGDIEEGHTKKKCDKGFSYKLIRNK